MVTVVVGGLLGLVGAYLVGWRIAFAAEWWVAKREGRTGRVVRHLPFLWPTAVAGVAVGAAIAGRTEEPWTGIVGGPTAGVAIAVVIVVRHLWTRSGAAPGA